VLVDLVSQSLQHFFMLVDKKDKHCEIVGSCICSCYKKSLYLVNQIFISNLWSLLTSDFLFLDVLEDELDNIFGLFSFFLVFSFQQLPLLLYESFQEICGFFIKGKKLSFCFS